MSKRARAWESKQSERWAGHKPQHAWVDDAVPRVPKTNNSMSEKDITIASLKMANERLRGELLSSHETRTQLFKRNMTLEARLLDLQTALEEATGEIVTLQEHRDAAIRRAQEMETQLYDMMGTEEW